jgi:histone H2A
MAGSNVSRGSKKGKKTPNAKKVAVKHMRAETRAGLQFPVGRIRRWMRASGAARSVGYSASVYMAAVLEYLMAEVSICARV